MAVSISSLVNAFNVPGDMYVQGCLAPTQFSCPADVVTDTNVASGAAIDDRKVMHQHRGELALTPGTDVTTTEKIVHVVTNADGATIRGLWVFVDTAPTGGNKKYTIDVKKSTAGGAWASILTATTDVDSTATNRTDYDLTASLSSTSAIQGDAYKIIVTASGSTGSQGQGGIIHLLVGEDGAV